MMIPRNVDLLRQTYNNTAPQLRADKKRPKQTCLITYDHTSVVEPLRGTRLGLDLLGYYFYLRFWPL